MPHRVDPHPKHPAVPCLIRLHATLAGKILDNKREGERLADDMRHVEAVIRMFDPEFDVRRIAVLRRRRQNPYFKRGTVWRAVLEVLKAAEAPMGVSEISRKLLASAGVENPTAADLTDMDGSVRRLLTSKEGTSVENAAQGIPARWRLRG